MSDLISRQAALDALEKHEKSKGHNYYAFVDIVSECAEIIRDVPSAQPEPQWIPCSERLPELGREVLVYAIGKDDGFIGNSVIAISERFIFRLFPSSPGVEEWRSPWEYFDSNYEITHWMPLPDPPKGEAGMSNIRFYIPKDESIPTDLRLYVGRNYIKYERTRNGFLFKTLIDDEGDAMKVVQKIVEKMISEHDESEHGVSWCTISLAVVPQDERYKIGTWVEWKYRVRDSY